MEIMWQCGYHDSVLLRDARYNQVIHMMTAAKGAESFYQLDNNPSRSEGLELAREMDTKAATVSLWADPGRRRGLVTSLSLSLLPAPPLSAGVGGASLL